MVFPILAHNDRAYTGKRLADQDIIKIQIGKAIVYEHPSFHQPNYHVVIHEVHDDSDLVKSFDTEQDAKRWVEYMYGQRVSLAGRK